MQCDSTTLQDKPNLEVAIMQVDSVMKDWVIKNKNSKSLFLARRKKV